MSFTESRVRALRRKQEVITAALDTWLSATAGEGTRKDPAFAIHYTQAREADRVMKGLRDATASGLDHAIKYDGVLRRGAAVEATLLAACQVWEFYRTRFAQRLDAGLATFLRVADELAWQCYRPVRDFALGESPLCKAPPLVYLNSSWSPFTVVRDREYEAEAVPRAFLRNADFKTALSRLPFPVVGVPWYQTVYLPDAVSICHEIGHAVEADFRLDGAVAAAVDKAVPGARAAVWRERGSELFADYYACLSVGPAFPWALANILLAESGALATGSDPQYPSPYARMLFNARVLHCMGFAAEAKVFADAWEAQARDPGIDAVEVADALSIAGHLVGGNGGDDPPGIAVTDASGETTVSLRTLVGFTRPQQDEVETEITALKEGGLASSADIRVLFASATMMWRDADFGKQAELLKVMREACVDTRRNDQARLPADAVSARADYLVDTGKAVAAAFLDG